LCATGAAHGESIVLRMATPAPEGTGWAREAHSFERDIAQLTQGQVRMKWYLGGTAGDELAMLDRMKREQLDGVASGGMLCQRLAPSMRVLRIVGLFQSRDESAFVSSRLKETFDAEFLKAGFVNLGEMGVGPDVIFSRKPVTSMAELKQARLWIWDLDQLFKQMLTSMGVSVVPRSLVSAGHDYDSGLVDGFLAVPSAALAFQWSTEVRYYAELHSSFLRGCLVMSSRAFDQLPHEGQQAVRQAAARTLARLEEIGRAQDEALLGGLFEKQGLKRVPVSATFRAEFLALALQTRERLTESAVSIDLLQRVLSLLADYRAVHRALDGGR
jgi:TRAP-type C4-dicarboxylate transport system substrate-binding protein